jgi:ribosome-associated protein
MDENILLKEVTYTAVRSGGPGGQHANKVSSKVILQFNLKQTRALSDLQKITASHQLSSKLSKDGVLTLTCDESRSQHENKEIVTNRFLRLMRSGIKRPKKRIATKISKAVKAKRLASKKKKAVKKSLRQKPKLD